jgi:hypothetical protein
VKIKGLPATSQRAYLLVNSPNDFKSNESKLTVPDYFEIERLVEDLAKLYATACATSWFKVTHNKKPTREEFRNKVVEFMRHFDFSLEAFPQSPESDNFKKYAKGILETEIRNVLSGKNNEVEKRYKYYADYS